MQGSSLSLLKTVPGATQHNFHFSSNYLLFAVDYCLQDTPQNADKVELSADLSAPRSTAPRLGIIGKFE